MNARTCSVGTGLGLFAFVACLAIAQPAAAQQPEALQTLREQYDVTMSNLQRILEATGDTASEERAGQGREAMRMLTNDQLAKVYSKTRVPDLSVAAMASQFLASRLESRQTAGAANPDIAIGLNSPGLPGPVPIVSNCNSVNIDATERYALLIIKEVANSILAAAAWVCNEDILGENGSLACVPLAIAADVANGFFDTATFCAGEVTANQVDGNFNRLQHIHDDLDGAITTIVNNNNANTNTIVNNDNTNTTTIVNNDNVNRVLIVNNDNANLVTSINNANANKNELRDLILRTQIEADLAMPDSGAAVALFETPNANGGYLDLVMTIVTQTLANVQAAGGSISNAQPFLSDANAAKAAGSFKTAYSLYRKAYKAAGK